MEARQLSRIPVLPGMKKYGDATPLYTKGVALYIIFFSLILSMQWFVDVWAWGNTWGFTYAANDQLGWIWSRFLGLIFSTVILVFEIMYITQDTSTSTTQGDVFRLLFALFVGWGLTSVAVEVSWFAPDIEKSIVAEEKANVDKIVQMANETEEKKCDQLLIAAQKELGENAVTEAAKAQGDLDRYVAERKAQRDAVVKEVDKVRSDARTEAAGKISGHYGNGPAAKMMAEQAENLAATIEPFDAKTAQEVERLTALRDAKQKDNRQALQKRLDQIRKDKEVFLDRIAALSQTTAGRDELAAKYGGGSWQVSRGALHRFSKMVEMTDTIWTPAWCVKWLCRGIMLVFTIIIIGGKRFAPHDWKQYCNRGQQGRAGHREARNNIDLEGYNPDTYGLNIEVRLRLAQHFDARQKLVEARLNLDRMICELTRPDMNGICRTHRQIESLLHERWLDDGEKCRINLVSCEETMMRDGISVPIWPAMLISGSDLLLNKAPWSVSKDRLSREYGWVDPTSSIEERRRLFAACQADQTTLAVMLAEHSGQLRSIIETSPDTPIAALKRQRQHWVHNTLLPFLSTMETQERRLRQLGGEVPAWPSYFPDPRATIVTEYSDLNEDELKNLGWIDPQERTTV